MNDRIWTIDDCPQDLVKQAVEELLSPGYGSREIGFVEFDGGVLLSHFKRLRNCTCDMYRWWFAEYMVDTPAYKLWSSDHESLRWENKPGKSPVGGVEVNGEFGVVRRSFFRDPAEVFDFSRFAESNIRYAQYSVVVHTSVADRCSFNLVVGRDTECGCEIRGRTFQIGGKISTDPNEGSRRTMRHSFDEGNDLAKFLPVLYWREHNMAEMMHYTSILK